MSSRIANRTLIRLLAFGNASDFSSMGVSPVTPDEVNAIVEP